MMKFGGINMINCPLCKQPTAHLAVDYETEYNNQLCDLITGKILNAIRRRKNDPDKSTWSYFGSAKLNKIVKLATRECDCRVKDEGETTMLKKYWLVAYCFLNNKGTVLVNNAAFYDSLAAWTASNISSRLFTLLWAQEITEEEFNHLKENTDYVS